MPVETAVSARIAAPIGELDDPPQQDAVPDELLPDTVGERKERLQVAGVRDTQNGLDIRLFGPLGGEDSLQDGLDAPVHHRFRFPACLR